MRVIIEWQNNYFRIIGSPTSLKIIQKNSGAVAIPCDHNRYLLIKIRRNDSEEHWEFPRGFCAKNEDYQAIAIRELAEETNLKNPRKVKQLGIVMPDSGLLTSKIGLVLIDVSFNQQIKLQASESILEYRILDLRQIGKMILTGKIVDGFTMAAYCHLLDV